MHVFTFLASPVAQQQWDDITPFSPTFNVQGSNNIRKVKIATQQNINSTLCNFVPDEREDGKKREKWAFDTLVSLQMTKNQITSQFNLNSHTSLIPKISSLV